MGGLLCKSEQIDFDDDVELYHFHLMNVIGKGAFGKVRVVQHKKTHKYYALKYIDKERCVKSRSVENIIMERRLLERISSPFVCNLRYAFQDEEHLYMVLDLMMGGDMRFLLDRRGALTEPMVQFYAAELSHALQYLHSRNIVHRDLKPSNILFDEHGHAHITDFNIATFYKDHRPLTSVVGSLAYMAPEVLARLGYDASVDWWSLGIILYECTYGRRPYATKSTELLQRAIIYNDIPFPKSPVGEECLDFIRKLLSRDSHKRIGSRSAGGFEALKQHSFFNDINWDLLVQKKLTSPYVPDSQRPNFAVEHELEELLLTDRPLTDKRNRRNKNIKRDPSVVLPPQYQYMESHFKLYDYTRPATFYNHNQPNKPITTNSPQLRLMSQVSSPPMSPIQTVAPEKSRIESPDQTSRARGELTTTIFKDVMEGRDDMIQYDSQIESAISGSVRSTSVQSGEVQIDRIPSAEPAEWLMARSTSLHIGPPSESRPPSNQR
ncbi:kinase-like domain-containing protein [Polychytrium aggregatum]|uniref:kinase-like domain-containing protein n=1 Tax=Polychytrium aggregatum TaxID=110093 RepID=UPI0022FED392|nr:kinase-like domain-containing protein [Polychytrium aggregatum]KAI9203324.1 kinase-like domain-containing protein [Polychytrium aggregatum]